MGDQISRIGWPETSLGMLPSSRQLHLSARVSPRPCWFGFTDFLHQKPYLCLFLLRVQLLNPKWLFVPKNSPPATPADTTLSAGVAQDAGRAFAMGAGAVHRPHDKESSHATQRHQLV